ncbi:MAG: hypothetical protein AB7O39_03110 [Flavobacteriaceae bacterium]
MTHALRGALRLACVLAVALPTLAYAEPSDLIPPQGGLNAPRSVGHSRIVAIARADIGKNPTGMRYLWCQAAVNRWVQKAGYRPTGSNHSSSSLKWQRVSRASARPGDIVYRPRRGGGHVELFVRWANSARTRYVAITGNSCGKRGRRYVCEVTRTVSGAHRFVRPR